MAKAISIPSMGLARENEELRAKLAEAQEVIRAIQAGDVDAVVVSGPQGEQVFTLQGAEYAYRALVEAMNEGAATVGSDGTVFYCNQRLSDLLGIPLEQIIGRSAVQLFADEAKPTFLSLFAHALAGNAATDELELKALDGRRVPGHISLREMKADEPAALCMVVTDLTERKQRDELIEAGRLATSILESAAEAIAVCDESGRIIRVNEALEDLCGFNPLFQPFDRALPLEISGEPAAPVQQFSISAALAGVVHRAWEVSFRRKDGQTFSLLLSSGRIISSSGVVGCVLTLTDVTERKRAQKALLRSEKLASVGRMAATVAHEINNPLAAVTNVLFLARSTPGLPESARQYLETADAELMRIAHITRQSLGFYRESSLLELTSVPAVLDSVVDLLKSRIEAKHAVIDRQWDEDVQVTTVKGELRQVLSNLLINSVDAIDENGTIKLRVSTGADFKNGRRYVRITVADNGKGISASSRRHLFEPFFTTKGSIGTGLGLWVSKQLVNRHGGKIQMRSSTSGARMGTVFSVVLPIE